MFSDWGATSTPASGVYVFQDHNGNPGDGTGFSGTAKDINYQWMAVSTASGGSAPVSGSNPIQDVFFRIDTFSTTAFKQTYNVLLNLGTANPGSADHLLLISVDPATYPQVKIVLSQFGTPYPSLRSYDAGSPTAMVSNVIGNGVIDGNAMGAMNIYEGTYYGIEVKVPISWFGQSYGGTINGDGSGINKIVVGTLFTNAGGTTKDTLGNTTADFMFMTDFATGETTFVTTTIAKIGFTTAVQTPSAGTVSAIITIQTQMATGEAKAVGTATTVLLASTSPTGRFDTSPTGPFNGAINSVTIGAGSSSVSFYYKDTTAGNPSITAAESPETGWTNGVQQITIKPGALDHFGVTGYPASTMAGQPFADNVMVKAYDVYNNIKTDYTGQVYFASTDPNASLPFSASSKYTFKSGDAGVHAFAGSGFAMYAPVSRTITLTDGSISITSDTITVLPAALHHFTLTGYPGSTTAGAYFGSDIIVSAFDQYGNLKTDYTGQVYFTSTDPYPAALPFSSGSKYGFTTGPGQDNGVHHFAGGGFALYSSGTQNVRVTDGLAFKSSSINVLPASIDHLALTGVPATTSSGHTFGNVIVAAVDAYANIITDYSDQVYFTSTDATAQLPYDSANRYMFNAVDQGTHSFSGFIINILGVQTISVTDDVRTNTSGNIQVYEVPDHLDISVAGNAVAGSPFSVTVTVFNIHGNVLTGFLGDVHFETTDQAPGVVLPSDYTFTTEDNGRHNFTGLFVLTGAGTQRLNVSVPSISGLESNTTVTVAHAPLDHFLVTGYHSERAGVSFGATITANDAYGNLIDDYDGTISFASNDTGTGVALPGRYTYVQGDEGAHSFTDGFILVTSGVRTIIITDDAQPSVQAVVEIDVSHNDAVGFEIDTTTLAPAAGEQVSFTPLAHDMYGNDWVMTGPVLWLIDPQAEGSWLENTYTSSRAGTWNVSAVTEGLNAAVKLTVDHAQATTMTIAPRSLEIVAGESVSYAAIAYDRFGNSWNITTITSWTIDPEAHGEWTSNLYGSVQAGDWTVTGRAASLNGTSPLTVIHGQIVGLSIIPQGVTIKAGASMAFYAMAHDIYGNQWNVTSAVDWTASSWSNGSWADNDYTTHRTGTWTVTGAYGDMIGLANITVAPGPLDHFIIDVPAAIITNAQFDMTVTAYDVCGNIKTDYDQTAVFSLTHPGSSAGFPSNYTFTDADEGRHIFVNCLVLDNSEDQEITITDGEVATRELVTIASQPAVAGSAWDLEIPLYILMVVLLPLLLIFTRKNVVILFDDEDADMGGSTDAIIIQVQNFRGKPVTMKEDTVIHLFSSEPSASGKAEGTNSAASDVVIRKGEHSTLIHLNDELLGTPTITVRKGKGYLWKAGSYELVVEADEN